MGQRVFSTGTLTADVTVPVAKSSLVGAIGEVDTNAAVLVVTPGAVDAAYDDNTATLLSLGIESATDFQFLRLDLGASKTVREVVINKAVGATFRCYVSNTASTTNAVPGLQLGVNTAAAERIVFSGTERVGRYVYISCSAPAGAGTYSLAEVEVHVAEAVSFALLQDITAEGNVESAKLFAPVTESVFADTHVEHTASISLKAKTATISAVALAAVLGAINEGTAPVVSTVSKAVALPEMSATLVTEDAAGKSVTLNLNLVRCPGIALAFGLSDFVKPDFPFVAFPDTDGNIGTIEFED